MEEFVKDRKVFCKLCFDIINYGNFKIIDEIMKEALDVLQLKVNEQESNTAVICNICCMRLFAAFNFKTTCLNTEAHIFPYVNAEIGTPVDLREIYLKEKGRDILENERICRLCMQTVSCGFISVKEVDVDILHPYIPEINFNITKEPIICKICLESLDAHTSFLKDCLNVEEKNKNTYNYEVSAGPFFISTEKIELKSEDYISPTLKDECIDYANGDKPEYITPDIADNNFCVQTDQKSDVSDQMYKCHLCNYKTSQEKNFKKHELKHSDITQKQAYKCDSCDFETIHKSSFTRHQLRHKNIPEEKMYKCDKCDYKTGQKQYLKGHMIKHTDIPEEQMYKCHSCGYKTSRKRCLKRHERSHKGFLENQLYKCDWCNYKTIYVSYFTEHQVASKYISEGHMYRCDFCDYKNCEKKRLIHHRSTHRLHQKGDL